MTRWPLLGTAVAIALVIVASANPAEAASAVTFVSRAGTDTGACTRAAPCRTFRYALTQTSSGGVLTAIEPGGYAPVNITQSVTIAGPGKGAASMSPREATSNVGVAINAPGGTVILRGLEIDGGFNGIDIAQAATVVIMDSVIIGNSNLAINVSDTSARVLVQDTTVRSAPIYANAAVFVGKRLTVAGSPGVGLAPFGGRVVLDDCTISGSNNNVIAYSGTTIIKHGVLAVANVRGMSGETNGTVYFDTTTTFGNGVGVDTVGPTFSYGNNNFPDGTSGTITPIAGD